MTAAAKTDDDYWRVRITARLRTLSPLHCGDGGAMPAAAWSSRVSRGSKGHINTVCQGAGGPYIPASTLRGSLRERCPSPDILFGSPRSEGSAGKVRVYDAFIDAPTAHPVEDGFWSVSRGTTIRDGVSIDPVTGTAAEGRLFAFEIIPVGSVATLTIEADRVSAAQVDQLLGLIHAWDGCAATALGRGLSRGWGRVKLDDSPKVQVLADADIRTWLANAGTESAAPKPHGPTVLPKPLPALAPQLARLRFLLRPSAPLLVNEPGRVQPRSTQNHEPALEYMRTADGAAVIPGTSLRGALRARAARILGTLLCADRQVPSGEALAGMLNAMVDALFGTERSRSPLWIGEARAPSHKPHRQQFIAVDRFTGGVAGGALYAVTAADCERLEVEASLDLQRLPQGDWWKGLLLFIARDLIEGDIPFGWGKSRGFGVVHAVFTAHESSDITSFEDLLKDLDARCGPGSAAKWVAALEKEIARVRGTVLGDAS